ncbi:uncharacterized protein V1518DRAFT_410808 [Limtongia smithiae]|uniref:uncharacterized protein n=1 Tax=Limtongia smithiae TaxID=1125753 RepID=UPI0034CE2AA5
MTAPSSLAYRDVESWSRQVVSPVPSLPLRRTATASSTCSASSAAVALHPLSTSRGGCADIDGVPSSTHSSAVPTPVTATSSTATPCSPLTSNNTGGSSRSSRSSRSRCGAATEYSGMTSVSSPRGSLDGLGIKSRAAAAAAPVYPRGEGDKQAGSVSVAAAAISAIAAYSVDGSAAGRRGSDEDTPPVSAYFKSYQRPSQPPASQVQLSNGRRWHGYDEHMPQQLFLANVEENEDVSNSDGKRHKHEYSVHSMHSRSGSTPLATPMARVSSASPQRSPRVADDANSDDDNTQIVRTSPMNQSAGSIIHVQMNSSESSPSRGNSRRSNERATASAQEKSEKTPVCCVIC